jgi:hypothetical protein
MKLFPLLLTLGTTACATTATTHVEPTPRRGFLVMIAEHDGDPIGKTPPVKLEPPILAIASGDPTNAVDQNLATSDGSYSIKVSWRPNGADATHSPCLDVTVSRRAKHPLPDADIHGCIMPNDNDTWLGEISSEHGKALRAAVTFLPARTNIPATASVMR